MGRNNQQRRRAKAKARRAATSSPGASFGAGARPTVANEPTDADECARLVVAALRAMEHGHPEPVEAAVAYLADFSQTTQRRLQMARTIMDLLRAQLDQAWQGGWQPADLVRLARRTVGGTELAVLGDAVVADLGRYAAGTVDRRWPAQLREAGATRWWGIDTDPLVARAAAAPGGWAQVCTAALRVIGLLSRLPALEVIGPRPGEATPHTDDGAEGPDVDERILSRVRQLLAKAESTTFDAEAETFTAGAQALMARHSIDAAMLQLQGSGGRSDAPRARRIGIDRPYESPKAMLLGAVADANRCRIVWSKELGFATVLGFAPDLEAVETLFTSLLVQATQAVTKEGSRRSAGRSRTRSFRSSFLTSYAGRIGERLREVTQAETDAATGGGREGFGVGPEGGEVAGSERPDNALVRVLADRSGAVDDAVAALFPRLVTRHVSLPQDHEGWISGRAAADRATLDLHARVSGAPSSRVG